MKAKNLVIKSTIDSSPPCKISEEITEADIKLYFSLVTTELSGEQKRRISEPEQVCYRQDSVLALHWHPEFIPMDLILERVRKTFPNSDLELIVPTNHNRIDSVGTYSGVEIDCYSRGFNRKVQLLTHFESSRLEQADVFKSMLAHTFKYRTSQLYEFIDTLLEPKYEDRRKEAAARTGADADLIAFVQTGTRKIKQLIDKYYSETPLEMLRNKLLRNYFETFVDVCDEHTVHRAQVFLQAVKQIVKRYFSHTHFYETEEIIEEVRGLGGGIVIPHPEQFWPILLAGYDVDGYEVWNPQSREYTEFLITVVNRENQNRDRQSRPLLIMMGDDCHMGEKVKDPKFQDPEKVRREIGVQPVWDDPSIRKALVRAGVDRRRTITEYSARLDG